MTFKIVTLYCCLAIDIAKVMFRSSFLLLKKYIISLKKVIRILKVVLQMHTN